MLIQCLGLSALVMLGAPAVAAPHPALAAPLTLEDAIVEAQRHAPGLQASGAQVAQAALRRGQTKASFLPKLSLFMGYTPLYRFATEATGQSYTEGVVALKSPLSELGGALQFSAFDGMQNVYRLRAATQEHRASQWANRWEAFTLGRDVTYRYRECQAAQALYGAVAQQRGTLAAHLEDVRAQRAQAAATDFDVLRVEVQLQNAEASLLAAADAIAISRQALAVAMGLDDDARPLAESLPEPSPESLAAVQRLTADALVDRDDLRALHEQALAHGVRQREAQAYWVPKVDVLGRVSRYNNWDRSVRSHLFDTAYTLGAQVRMNVFDGLEARAQAQSAQLEQQKVTYRLRETQLQRVLAFERARRGYLYAASLYRARFGNILRAQKSLEIARAGFENGSRANIDVLDAQDDLFTSRAEATRALLCLARHAVDLSLALGKELT